MKKSVFIAAVFTLAIAVGAWTGESADADGASTATEVATATPADDVGAADFAEGQEIFSNTCASGSFLAIGFWPLSWASEEI